MPDYYSERERRLNKLRKPHPESRPKGDPRGLVKKADKCPVCGQMFDSSKTGEHSCTACGMPLLHDIPDQYPNVQELTVPEQPPDNRKQRGRLKERKGSIG